jgi:type II secretory pathway pseudopilin PulG
MSEIKCPSCGYSINVPKKKTGLWWGIGCLIAVVAMMIVLAIMGILAAIAIPSFMKARSTARMNVCVNNMKVINTAKEQAAQDQINSSLKTLRCPQGGEYSANPASQDPECSFHGKMSEPTTRRRIDER